uniref:restriction endonuclease subunit S n=2 Tax=Prevotella sp. TaxID=59823 RepID=UPI0025E1DE23
MMERYSEYKNSGVYYIPQIPSEWNVLKGKILFKQEKRPVNKEDEIVTCFRDGEVTLRKNRRLEGFTNSLKEIGYQGIRKGDLVIHNMDAFAGAIGVSDSDGKGTPVYAVCTPIREDANQFYYCYLLRFLAKTGFIQSLAKGIRERSTDFRYGDFKELLLPVPSRAEQDAIVRYLDSATSEIDKAIAMQQKMIDLLNERKQIIIQNAVTKGLDENVEMKESGVEFVNEIPHNWPTRRLKFSAWIRARLGWKGLKASEYVENGYPFLSAFNIENDHMKWNNLNFINKYRYDESPEIKLKVGDLLLVKDGAGIGKCARIDKLPYGESTANGSLAVITSYDMLDYRYLYYFMVSKSFKDHTELLINGMGVPHFTQGEMKKIVMPVPPQAEQQQIVTYLDGEMEKFDSAITNCQRQITLLQERKQIIINEVVTGKVRVS